MNFWSQFGMDPQTAGSVAQAGIDPMANFQQGNKGMSAYPTYPNAAGVGSQTAGSQNEQSTSSGAGIVTPSKIETPDTSSRGMSPYSLIGDANYREK